MNFFVLVLSILFFNSLLADSVVLPTEKYDYLPLPPLTNDLIKKENDKHEHETLGKIEQIVRRELEEDKSEKKAKPQKKSKRHSTKQVVKSATSGGAWDGLKDPDLERIIRDLLDDQYKELDKSDKTVSLNLKKVDVKRAFELIGKTSGVQIIVDSDIQGSLENVDLNNVLIASALRLLTSSNNPQLVVLKENEAVRIAKLTTAIDQLKTKAQDVLDKDYKNVCITIYHAKWNTEFKKRIEGLWQGIIGTGKDKDCSYLIFDDESKKLLCHSRQSQIDSFKEFISKIDIEMPQVKIDARIVIANKDFEESLGFDWSGYYDKRAYVSHSEFASLGARKNLSDDSAFDKAVNWSMNFVPCLGILKDNKMPIKIPFIWGNKDFDSNRINLILQAAETRNQIRTILKPSLLVNNDELAEILVGEQMPHETRIAETVEGQPSNITTTQYKDIGMKIRIKSTVAPDRDSVFLDVFVENSFIRRPRIEFDTLPTPGSKNFNYVIETSRSQNRVLLKSGQSTMIGGLIINSQERVQTGIPFLQDIPVLGLFFQGRRKAILEKQLLIFITPTIVT